MPAAAGFDGRGATVLGQKLPHGQVKIRLAKHTRHPNRRVVFERIVRSDEITVVELTPDSSIVGHLPASQITEAGWPDRAAGPRAATSAIAPSPRAHTARRLDKRLWDGTTASQIRYHAFP